MKNLGKVFEDNFRKSLPLDDNNLFYYRFKDGTANWMGGTNQNVRFQAKNICDCMLLYTEDIQVGGLETYAITMLHLIELKSHKGKSFPINCIRENQLLELYDASYKRNVLCDVIVFFSDAERCFSLDINEITKFIGSEKRKSIPISYFEEHGIEIEVEKLKTNYRYDIRKWLGER